MTAVRTMNSPVYPCLEMRGISKRFGATVALDDVDLKVNAGEIHALVGENGAGKSTLMKVLSGAHPLDRGRMMLDAQPYAPNTPLAARRTGVCMIYQELSLASHLSAEQNILLGVEPTWFGFLRQSEIRRRTVEALERLKHHDLPIDVPVSRLPIGAQQLVEVARAIVVGCRVLVLDEPTSSLSGPDVECLFDLIRHLWSEKLAIVYISHFLEEVKEIADRYTVLRDGRNVGSGDMETATAESLVELMVGRTIGKLFSRSSRKPGERILEVNHLAGHAKPQAASLELHRGEVLGIAGLVGAGRTELLRALFGLDAIRKGSIRFGAYLGPASPVRRWAQGAGILSENRQVEGVAMSMSIADNITLSKLDPFGPLGWIWPDRQRQTVQRWIDRFAIRCRHGRQNVGELSGGNQQKVALARLLHHDVDLLLLDEPTRGIDVGSKAEIYELIDQLVTGNPENGQAPRAILMVSSYLPELLGVCDRIAVMHRGTLGLARPADQLDEQMLMLEATGQK